jgi:hypothetical protein
MLRPSLFSILLSVYSGAGSPPMYIPATFPTLGFVFYSEDGGSRFFQKVYRDIPDYTE